MKAGGIQVGYTQWAFEMLAGRTSAVLIIRSNRFGPVGGGLIGAAQSNMRTLVRRLSSWVALLMTSATPMAMALPVGADLQVNTQTLSNQVYPGIATRGGDGFVVVWHGPTEGQPTSGTDIHARALDGQGWPIGASFTVNSYTELSQLFPVVSSDSTGGYVVAWQTTWTDDEDIAYRRFASDGTPLSDEQLANTYIPFDQTRPEAAMSSDGSFVIAWDGAPGDGGSADVIARFFNSQGSAVGGEVVVNQDRLGFQNSQAVAAGLDRVVVVWASKATPRGAERGVSGRSVRARTFTKAGSPLQDEFTVSSPSGTNHSFPSVAMGSTGEFVVTWTLRSLTEYPRVLARYFDSQAEPMGGEFQVNELAHIYTGGSVARAGPEGRFVLVWDSGDAFTGPGSPDGDGIAVQARFLDAQGPLGSEFTVNAYTTGFQGLSTVAWSDTGPAQVVWHSTGSFGTDNDGTSIQTRSVRGPLFFENFESGTIGGWALVTP